MARAEQKAVKIKISKDISLPLDIVTQTIAILAKRRAGKSYAMRKLVEQLLTCNQQVVLVDPKGDQWGIRSSADGKKPGYPIVILGGEHGDAPLESSGGELVAKLVVQDRVSVLLDLSAFRKHEVATFMTAFLENLYRLKAQEQYRTPMMLVIDEADAIAPQKPQKGEERMLGAAEDIVRRGGQRGIGCALITQRSAVLNKNVLTQAQMLIVLRTIAPQDLTAMKAWIDVHGTIEEGKELMDSLPSLPIGDAWFWSPGWPTAEGIFARSHVLPIETFDSGATPTPGAKVIVPKNLADVDLEVLKKQMAATIEKAKNDDPKLLRKKIAELEKEIAKRGENPHVNVLEVVKAAVTRRDAEWRESLKPLDQHFDRIAEVFEAINKVKPLPALSIVDFSYGEIERKKIVQMPGAIKTIGQARTIVSNIKKHIPKTDSTQPKYLIVPSEIVSGTREIISGITNPEQRILNAIGFLNAVGIERPSKEAVALIAKYTPTSGGYANLCGKLRSNGFIEYPSPGVLALTETGKRFTETPEFASTEEMREAILEQLTAPEQRILMPLISAYPKHISHEELAREAGYEPTSGGFANLKGRLRTFGLITYPNPGYTQAADLLFPTA